MSERRRMTDRIYEEADKAKPIAKINGIPVYDVKDGVALDKAELLEQKTFGGKRVETGQRQMTPDGLSYVSSNIQRTVIDPEIYFENRFKRIDVASPTEKDPDRTFPGYEVVIDYRAITEQASGNIYTNHVNAFIIGKKTEKATPSVLGHRSVSPDEFINDFREKFDSTSMATVLGIINSTGKGGGKEPMPESTFSL